MKRQLSAKALGGQPEADRFISSFSDPSRGGGRSSGDARWLAPRPPAARLGFQVRRMAIEGRTVRDFKPWDVFRCTWRSAATGTATGGAVVAERTVSAASRAIQYADRVVA